MKKIFLLIAMAGALMLAVSCGSDDEPKRGDGVFTVNALMVNHMDNTVHEFDAELAFAAQDDSCLVVFRRHRVDAEPERAFKG